MKGLDDAEVETLFPRVSLTAPTEQQRLCLLRKWSTLAAALGANTLKLVATLPGAEIVGLDATPGLRMTKGGPPSIAGQAQGLTSNLKCSEILAPGRCVLVTNTHDPESGEKLWMKTEGAKWGFEPVELQEGTPKDANMLGAMRGHWDGVKCWVGFLLVEQK
ncbi:S-adenosyl-L-methionine-dependent methyltransferase [Xylaria palmicola]|nr:S-adenosyl-L-methionine-dependent methyltransferase [Xylaria palmicola]